VDLGSRLDCIWLVAREDETCISFKDIPIKVLFVKSWLKDVKVYSLLDQQMDNCHILFFASFLIMSLQDYTLLSYEKEI